MLFRSCVHGSFEVFDSGGSWRFLFGKPLMRLFKAVHAYEFDTVTISSGENLLVLENKFGRRDEGKLEVLVAEVGVESKRMRKRQRAKTQKVVRMQRKAEERRVAVEEVEEEGGIEPTPICIVQDGAPEFQIDKDDDSSKVPVDQFTSNAGLFT